MWIELCQLPTQNRTFPTLFPPLHLRTLKLIFPLEDKSFYCSGSKGNMRDSWKKCKWDLYRRFPCMSSVLLLMQQKFFRSYFKYCSYWEERINNSWKRESGIHMEFCFLFPLAILAPQKVLWNSCFIYFIYVQRSHLSIIKTYKHCILQNVHLPFLRLHDRIMSISWKPVWYMMTMKEPPCCEYIIYPVALIN